MPAAADTCRRSADTQEIVRRGKRGDGGRLSLVRGRSGGRSLRHRLGRGGCGGRNALRLGSRGRNGRSLRRLLRCCAGCPFGHAVFVGHSSSLQSCGTRSGRRSYPALPDSLKSIPAPVSVSRTVAPERKMPIRRASDGHAPANVPPEWKTAFNRGVPRSRPSRRR